MTYSTAAICCLDNRTSSSPSARPKCELLQLVLQKQVSCQRLDATARAWLSWSVHASRHRFFRCEQSVVHLELTTVSASRRLMQLPVSYHGMARTPNLKSGHYDLCTIHGRAWFYQNLLAVSQQNFHRFLSMGTVLKKRWLDNSFRKKQHFYTYNNKSCVGNALVTLDTSKRCTEVLVELLCEGGLTLNVLEFLWRFSNHDIFLKNWFSTIERYFNY